jgi:uncharacterized membrane protein
MQNRTPSKDLDLELARARQLLAEGRRQEALVVALNLLQQALGQLRHSLLSLHHDLAQVKGSLDKTRAIQEEKPAGHPVDPRTGGPYYH